MGTIRGSAICCALTLFTMALVAGPVIASEPRHGYSLFGDLALPADFEQLEYVSSEAIKGGIIRLPGFNTFDSFNHLILKGNAPGLLALTIDTLTVRNFDEPSAQYGLIAETIEVADDGSWVEFSLRPEARFHDGHTIDVADVIFSFETLVADGQPTLRANYRNVDRIEQTGERLVRFYLKEGQGMELALTIGRMPVMAEHYWVDRDFTKTTLDAPLGSGPYRVTEFDVGRNLLLERVPDYWAEDLPIRKWTNNFDILRSEYYRDLTVIREALRAGNIDWFPEEDPKDWLTEYNIPAKAAGLFIQQIALNEEPEPMRGIVLNTRRAKFQDVRVREALDYAYNFEWFQKVLMFGWFDRTLSYFQETDLAAREAPDEAELAILRPYADQLPPELFDQPFRSPIGDTKGSNRANLRRASALLEEAGWIMRDGVRVNAETGEVFTVDAVLVLFPYQRLFEAYFQALKILGIEGEVRTVDASLYQSRLGDFDYDMIIGNYNLTLTPGINLRNYFSSSAADRQFSANWTGVKDPMLDDLVEGIISAKSRDELRTYARALDRVLMWGRYIIPGFHRAGDTYIFWNRFGRPARVPKFTDGFAETWWIDPEKNAAVDEFLGR